MQYGWASSQPMLENTAESKTKNKKVVEERVITQQVWAMGQVMILYSPVWLGEKISEGILLD